MPDRGERRTRRSEAGAIDPSRRPRLTRRRNAAAVERVIAALRADDRLVQLDDAAVATVRTTARALDAATGAYDVAVIARVHLGALTALLAGHAAPADDDLDRFLATLRGPAVGDPPVA